MIASDFREIAGGIQAIAIAAATVLGGAWALFQFFSLRALERAKLDLHRAKRELIERGILAVDLKCEVFAVEGSQLLHVRIALRNVGNGLEVVKWSQARMSATRYAKTNDRWLPCSDEVFLASPPSDIVPPITRLVPGASTEESFLIAIPSTGIYCVSFFVSASPVVKAATISDLGAFGVGEELQGEVMWGANTFVAVEQERLHKAPSTGAP